MADDLTIVASLLRDTNKKLDKLSEDNEKGNSVTSIIAQSLPEILSDRAIASRQEKFDQKQGITEVDEKVVENTTAAATTGKEIVSAITKIPINIPKAPGWTKLGKFLADTNPTARLAEELKEKLESQFMVAEDNLEFQKLSYQSRKEIAEQRIKDATSPARKKEIREEARADARKNGSRFEKIVAGITGLLEIGKKGLKTAALGGLAILSTLAIGGFLLALGKFLQSDTFKDITAYIFDTIIPKVKELYDAFFGEGGGIGAGFSKLAEMFSDKGALVIGLGLLTAKWLGKKAIGLLLSPLTLGFKAIKTAFSLAGGALSALGLKNTPKTTTAPRPAAGAAPAAGGTKPSVVGTDSKGNKIVNSAKGNPMQMGADGKATSQKPVGKVTATKAPMSLNPLKKFPKVGKFLGVLKRIPGLSAVFAISDLVSIFSNDKMSTKAKIAAGVGVFGGVGASMLGGALGMMFGGPIGAAIGGLAGYFGGETLATGLMQWMLGEKVDAFPDAWWAPDINGWMNGSGEKKKAGGGASPTGSPTMSPIIKGNTGGNVTPLQTKGSGTTGADITPSNKLSASIDRLSAKIEAQGAAGPTNIVDARQSSSVTTTGSSGQSPIVFNRFSRLNMRSSEGV
jgi:hypothetical protein